MGGVGKRESLGNDATDSTSDIGIDPEGFFVGIIRQIICKTTIHTIIINANILHLNW